MYCSAPNRAEVYWNDNSTHVATSRSTGLGSYRMYGSAFFHLGPSIFASQGPTPAARPSGWTLSCASEPCLSTASWLALPCLASISVNEAGRGVNGFGSFCRNKRGSAAGPRTGNTEHHFDTKTGYI